MKAWLAGVMLCGASLLAQSSPAPGAGGGDPWSAVGFLVGTWEAKTQGGSAGAQGTGTYTFQMELGHHVLARHSNKSGCKGPEDYNCEHGDLLYVYQDAKGEPLKAIYFDNEGHVIHYEVSSPDPDTAVCVSEASRPGPQFRLVYQLRDNTMSGKFQMRMPGQTEWKSYLEWSGAKR